MWSSPVCSGISAQTWAFEVCKNTHWHHHNQQQHTAVAWFAGQRQSGNTATSGLCTGASLNNWCAVPVLLRLGKKHTVYMFLNGQTMAVKNWAKELHIHINTR